jgi:redox-sensitive bicupin YhaK (pirin superfamily)
MVTLRRAGERGHADRGWLDARHSFSFANYYDPKHMGYGPLRVLNDDRFGPGRGFGTHPHDNMEILTYVLSGQLGHQDSTGGTGVLRRGDVQRMSAGTGVEHSEFNASDSEWLHLLQIWIEPDVENAPPRYEDRHFPEDLRRGRLALIASPDGAEGSLSIYQDARVYATLLSGEASVTHPIGPGRHVYVHVALGAVTVNGHALTAGDAAMLDDEAQLTLGDATDADVLVFDLP